MMKTKDSKEKQFKQLSEEELEQVNGGKITFIVGGAAIVCALTECPTGQHVDIKTCQCVPITNTIARR